MEKGWKEVFFTDKEYLATMARDILETGGVPSVILDQQDSTYITFGEYRVFVPEDSVSAALELIKNLKD